ncbi:MAG: hypothetical protein EZS28_000616 [Streblomastix strix]|uniref:Uncharacterized protein n=1 Tax=Streblomastix strix TaxID=222440 RepID=A0A5J4X986_9EUKA|nr:MAG: hypothetical protein EZS28_000616 [Streblomastix strix]
MSLMVINITAPFILENADDIRISISLNDDNNLSPPPSRRTEATSLPAFTKLVALTLLVNVLDPLTVQFYIVITKLPNVLEPILEDNFASISEIVKQVLVTGSYVSSYVAPNGLTYFNLPVIVYQIEPQILEQLLSISVLEYVSNLLQLFDKSVGALSNPDIGLVSRAQRKSTVLSALDLIDDDPVTVDIPSMELTNLQLLLNAVFAVIVYEVLNVAELARSVVPNLSSNNSPVFVFVQQLLQSVSSISIKDIN